MEQSTRSFRASLAAMLGICLVIMLIAIDSTVVGTAMPRIVAELKGYDLYPWIASAYLLTNAVMIPITGRLGDLYGRKYFVLAAVLLFTLASALCGMAQSMLQLVLARGLQGVGGGMLVGVAFASVPDLFPDRLQRVRWQAMLSATFGIATAVGPSLGGWLTEHAGWRSVFYVNLPVALLALPVIWRYLPRIVHQQEEDKRIDWLGALLLAGAISSLLLATENGQSHGFTSPLFIGLGLAALALGTVFVRHQQRSAAPIIPGRLFANPDVRTLAALGALTGFSMFVLVFYAPLLLQGSFGLSPKAAGLALTPLLVFITIGSIVNGRLLPRLPKPERVIAWGQMVSFVGSLLLTQLSVHSPAWISMSVFALCGFSLGFQLPNLTLQMQAVAGARDVGIGSALIQTSRMLGSMIGVSVAGVLVNAAYARDLARQLPAPPAAMLELLSTPQILIRQQDQTALAALGDRLGVNAAPLIEHARLGLEHGIDIAFLLCAAVAILSVAISFRLPPYVIRQPQPASAD